MRKKSFASLFKMKIDLFETRYISSSSPCMRVCCTRLSRSMRKRLTYELIRRIAGNIPQDHVRHTE